MMHFCRMAAVNITLHGTSAATTSALLNGPTGGPSYHNVWKVDKCKIGQSVVKTRALLILSFTVLL